jgi:hypothetical protein
VLIPSALRTGLGTAAETRNSASKTTSEIDDKNQIEEQFMSSQAFHRTSGGCIQKITAGVQFEPRNIESFDPVTQEKYRFIPTTIPHKIRRQMIKGGTHGEIPISPIPISPCNDPTQRLALVWLKHWTEETAENQSQPAPMGSATERTNHGLCAETQRGKNQRTGADERATTR